MPSAWGRPASAPPSSRCRRSLQPYADPVHDSTWRWWENKKQDQVHGEDCESVGGAASDPPHHHRPSLRVLTFPTASHAPGLLLLPGEQLAERG